MIAEAIDTAVTLGWAFAAWLVLTSLAATAALYAVIAVVWWVVRAAVRGVKAARRRHAPVSAPRSPSSDSRDAGIPPSPSRARTRPLPSWARTQPLHEDTA